MNFKDSKKIVFYTNMALLYQFLKVFASDFANLFLISCIFCILHKDTAPKSEYRIIFSYPLDKFSFL